MRKVIFVIMAVVLVVGLVGCGGNSKPKELQSSQVVDAFKQAGLECENTRAMTKEDYGMAPMSAKEGTRFFIPSLGADNGGRIMSFVSKDDLTKTKDFYEKMGKESAMFFSWVFAKDNILVQINGNLKEDKAKQYEAALNNLK